VTARFTSRRSPEPNAPTRGLLCNQNKWKRMKAAWLVLAGSLCSLLTSLIAGAPGSGRCGGVIDCPGAKLPFAPGTAPRR